MPHEMQFGASSDSLHALSLDAVLEFFVETHFLVLVLFAIVSHHLTAAFAANSPWRPAAKYVVTPFALLLGWRLVSENDFRGDLGVAISITARWLVASWMVHNCAAMPGVFLMHLLVRYAQHEWQKLDQYTRDLHEWYLAQCKRRTPAPAAPLPPPPPTREALLASNSEQAKTEYEFECRIIKRANLDELEREAALEQAKQKYLEKLCRVLQ